MRNRLTEDKTLTDRLVLNTVSMMVATAALVGCHAQPPGGSPIETIMLGSTLDEINRQQEENAEAAKFVIYMHEFEINIPLTHPNGTESQVEDFEFIAPERVRGFRLTPYGEDHVARIAYELVMEQQSGANHWPMWDVVIERSETSRVWDTRHHYPVHFNPELDEARRQTVVAALTAFGVQNADELVVVAPAFSEGMEAGEAAAAYGSSRFGFNNNNNGNNNFGGQGQGAFFR
jgi:hypothetical protein